MTIPGRGDKLPNKSAHCSISDDKCLPCDDKQNDADLLKHPAATSYDAVGLLWRASQREKQQAVDPPSSDAVKHTSSSKWDDNSLPIWSKCHFVHTGLFTAQEAAALVSYFFEFLVPFTPIILPTYREAITAQNFLNEEPILATTILMIASRYMEFAGPRAMTRRYVVHDTLWEHLQGLVNHMIWGQEHFRGIFSGDLISTESAEHVSDSAHRMCPPLGGLRTLGACEALMLLSEWNPRAIHFPPREYRHAIFGEKICTGGRATTTRSDKPTR